MRRADWDRPVVEAPPESAAAAITRGLGWLVVVTGIVGCLAYLIASVSR